MSLKWVAYSYAWSEIKNTHERIKIYKYRLHHLFKIPEWLLYSAQRMLTYAVTKK